MYRRRSARWIVTVVLVPLGLGLIRWAKFEEGWDQAWRIEIGAAIALLGPLYFLDEVLRIRVDELKRIASESVQSYDIVRRLLPAGAKRTAVLDEVLAAVSARSSNGEFARSDVAGLLRAGGEGKVIALAVMMGDNHLIDENALKVSVANSNSGMEQYYALLLAEKAWDTLGSETQSQICAAIKADDNGRQFIKSDPHRAVLADAILARCR